ncbi:MAG: sulfurtransferase TusA family protein [Burkholderiales bacterium]|uniref:sulfurtransferase TusA family protein n=1 Tax=Nitrosomonas sp. TaxID=42353 RepID=UPI001D93ED57|nr:sulfurtransferase TusA family protein [Nitrosomonas sp.]MCB1947406.1 sulfurtransferase TusA family protein [Nitrosomonas sp.]MCP5242932.1 sulfurtransferase TusA family protein [Burkholderiales bacterium]
MLQEFDQELDARGLVCPLPILRTKQSLAGMSSGQVLKIVATDPGAEIDIQVFAEQTGNRLLAMSEIDTEFVFFLKKK